MTPKSNREAELAKRLTEVDQILDALRNHKVDAVIGESNISLLRLKEVEDKLQEQMVISAERLRKIEQSEKRLQQLNATLEERVADRTAVAEERAEKLREMALQMTQVEEQERQRLARVLHDGLQQLLIGAKMNTSLVSGRLSDNERVSRELQQLQEILDQAIEASRSLSYELSPPILHDHGLIAALHWLADLPHMQGLSVHIDADKEIPPLSQNLKVFLFHSIRELLINIIKHADVNRADVVIRTSERYICIDVIDEGKGFDASIVSKHSPSLGLRGIREKLELLKGEMKIESEPGKGSHFSLRVPIIEQIHSIKEGDVETRIVEEAGQRSNKQTSRQSDSSTITVLVVDDHQIMRSGLIRMLEEAEDITIIGEANDGQEAVEFVRNRQPDVIIMDISMPKMSGIEATQTIMKEFPWIQIVGLSMHVEGEYKRLMKEAGATDLLNKAGPVEQLLTVIRSVN